MPLPVTRGGPPKACVMESTTKSETSERRDAGGPRRSGKLKSISGIHAHTRHDNETVFIDKTLRAAPSHLLSSIVRDTEDRKKYFEEANN